MKPIAKDPDAVAKVWHSPTDQNLLLKYPHHPDAPIFARLWYGNKVVTELTSPTEEPTTRIAFPDLQPVGQCLVKDLPEVPARTEPPHTEYTPPSEPEHLTTYTPQAPYIILPEDEAPF